MYESLIAEYLDYELPELIPRQDVKLDLPAPAQHNLIYSIIGVRRCGKTFFLFQLMKQLIESGVPRNRIFYFTFDDERILPFSDQTPAQLLDAYFKLVPEALDGCYLFFDEIQEAPHWANFVRRAAEQHKTTVVITGSSSKLLSRDIPTQLRGRSIAKEMWPYSFKEFCIARDINCASARNGVYTAQTAGRLETAFGEYLDAGGFPAVQPLPPRDRIALLQAYASEIVTKDVLERFGTTSFRVAERFARSALRSTGLKFSINKQGKDLRSAGLSVSNDKLYALLGDLEDAHLVFGVHDYNLSIRENARSSAKIYAVDPGLALAVAPASHLDLGQRLETAVFVELKRRYGDNRESVITSYSATDCPEVDFVVGDVALEQQYQLIQVTAYSGSAGTDGDAEATGTDKDSAALEATLSKKYRSEVGNLVSAMKSSGLDQGTIITLSEEQDIHSEAGIIKVVPAWKWFLERE